jgi:hypothetical protein
VELYLNLIVKFVLAPAIIGLAGAAGTPDYVLAAMVLGWLLLFAVDLKQLSRRYRSRMR